MFLKPLIIFRILKCLNCKINNINIMINNINENYIIIEK